MKTKRTPTAGLTLALGIVLGVGTALADDGQRPSPNTTPQWWQFVGSIPTKVNPGLDPAGANCVVGQNGSVWYLVGTFSSGPVTRNCSIPAGTALFFPVVNFVNINTPNVCGQGPGSLSVDVMRSQIAPYLDGATNLSVLVDGHAVEHPRVKSNPFAVAVPADNIFVSGCGGMPAGIYSPVVDDGYYAFLGPLKEGSHVLRVHAEIPGISFVLDVTYNLTVVPVQLK